MDVRNGIRERPHQHKHHNQVIEARPRSGLFLQPKKKDVKK